MRLLGLDPGLRTTGWGVIEANGNSLSHVADGAVRPDADAPLSERLAALYGELSVIVDRYALPDPVAEAIHIGLRLPFLAPLGAFFIAWSSPAEFDA